MTLPVALRFPLALVLLESTLYLSQDMYLPALPLVQRDFGISAALAQSTFSVWLIGATALQLLAGPLSERHGRRTVLLGCGVLFVLASAGCALPLGFSSFQLMRLLQGCALCGVLVAGYASVHETLGTQQAIRTQAWMSAVTVLAPALGPLLGAALLLRLRWPMLFALLALLALLACVLLHRWMPETVDVAAAAPLSLRRSVASYRALLMQRDVRLPLLAGCLILGALLSWNVAGPFVLRGGARAYVPAQAWLYGMFMLGTRVVARRVARHGPYALIRGALRLCLLGGVLAALAAWLRLPEWCTVGLFGVYLMAAGMLFAPLIRVLLERGTHASQPMGMSMALVTTGLDLAAVLCTLAVAWAGVASLRSFTLLAAMLAAAACALGERALREPGAIEPPAERR